MGGGVEEWMEGCRWGVGSGWKGVGEGGGWGGGVDGSYVTELI